MTIKLKISFISVILGFGSSTLAAETSYSTYTAVITFLTTEYSTFTSISCPPPVSTSVVTSDDSVRSIVLLNTCNPDYTDYTNVLITVTNTNTETDYVTYTESAIPSSEIEWD